MCRKPIGLYVVKNDNLDEARFQSFVQILDAPVAPNVGLERLMAVKPVWQAA